MAAKASKPDFTSAQRKLNEELGSGDYRRVYLISGEQTYLRLQNRDKLVKALMGDGDAMNLTRWTGADVSARDIIDMACTLPFFADRRVIVLENTGLLNPKSASKASKGTKTSAALTAEAEKLAEFIPEIPESSALIFVEESADKRGRLYKAVDKCRK